MDSPFNPIETAIVEKLIILPPLLALIISGEKIWLEKIVPIRFVLIIFFVISGGVVNA